MINAPVFNRLTKYHWLNRVSFAMPGHKNGRGLYDELLDCDVTELQETVDLFHGCETVDLANALLSKVYGSDESRIMTEGSSQAIHAMLSAVLNPEETLLADVKCHKSAVNTCALCGFNLRLFDENDSLDKLLDKYRDIKAVIVTSPDYFGRVSDISALSQICHRRGLPLIVDEAHGAHFPASKRLPETAVRLGADAVCQSAHKTLNALTGAAFLHVNGSLVDRQRLWLALEMFSSTSPSYVIAASADIARAQLEDTDKWEKLFFLCERFKEQITKKTHIKILKNDDFSRIVLDFSAYGISGFDILTELSKNYGIDAEMAYADGIVMITTPENTAEDFDKMLDALLKLFRGLKTNNKPPVPVLLPPQGIIKPYTAFYSKGESVSLAKALGRTAKSSVTPYPPGIPVIVPGGAISQEQIDYIERLRKMGAKITGTENGNIQCVITEFSNGNNSSIGDR